MLPSVNRPHRLFAAIAVGATLLASALTAPAALPPLPDPNAPAPAASAPTAPTMTPALERARRGVVVVEEAGRPVGVGTVLGSDGRILTSLAALGTSEMADIRYADGTTVKAKLGHRDKAWDLALLVPQSGKWTDGLSASDVDPSTAELKAFVAKAPKSLALVATPFKSRFDARGKEGETLPGALDMDVKGLPVPAGAPIVDNNGGVVAIFVHACKAVTDTTACTPLTIGAPIATIRNFLIHTPATATQPAPWLGIRGESDSVATFKGVRVTAVANGSPAHDAGLKANLDHSKSDLIIAVDGQPVDSPERLSELIAKHGIGDSVGLLVYGEGRVREITVKLRAAP
jgi:serine protease Do